MLQANLTAFSVVVDSIGGFEEVVGISTTPGVEVPVSGKVLIAISISMVAPG